MPPHPPTPPPPPPPTHTHTAPAARASCYRAVRWDLLTSARWLQLDLVSEYWLDVFEPFLGRLESGYTPNPDLPCNVHIKFGPMWEYARRRLGADLLATGHYARLVGRSTAGIGPATDDQAGADSAAVQLARAVDGTKDQSYFLATVRP